MVISADLLHVIDDEAQLAEINIFISIHVHQLDDVFDLLAWKSEAQRSQRHVQVAVSVLKFYCLLDCVIVERFYCFLSIFTVM